MVDSLDILIGVELELSWSFCRKLGWLNNNWKEVVLVENVCVQENTSEQCCH